MSARTRQLALALPEPVFGEVCAQPESGCKRCGSQLTGRRTIWCSDSCRDSWYYNHRWSSARDEAMRRSDWRCTRCGSRAEEVDHIIERRGEPIHQHSCLHHQANLRPLCHECHRTRSQWEVQP